MQEFDFQWALTKLKELDPDRKFETMITTAAIIIKLLAKEWITPIILE